jgi:3-phenylpropionate/trans-cinnamate dioxygenase ferredoxin reductase component
VSEQTVVIVGAGHAGGSATAFLRQSGFEGSIVLIGEEPLLPYQRPPLSKAWLKGEADSTSLMLRPEAFYEKSNVSVRLSCAVTAIDRPGKTVMLTGGERVAYDKLILASGARARRLTLPGSDSLSLHELRNAADADRLKAALAKSKRIAIVGGGYIGLEVAASARKLGVDVVILERESRVLARVANPVLSEFFTNYHQSRGVEILTGVELAAFEATGVRLNDDCLIESDCTLVGVGAIPNDDMARAAGLKCEQGICVDLAARTSDPDIYAIGDVTWRPLPRYERNFRLESVPNALEQAKQAAADICGKPAPEPEVPWFWSDQYDLKLQIAGLAFGGETLLTRGDPATAKFALFHLRDNVVNVVEAVNSPQEFMIGKQLIASRKTIDSKRLADVGVTMKEVAV